MRLALVVCVMSLVSTVGAADRYVAQYGQTPGGGYTSWATAASNIQDGVDAADPGGTVWVGPGRYTLPPNTTNYPPSSLWSNVVYINRMLTLCAVSGAVHTVIDGEGANRGIAVNYTTATNALWVLDGFTISNCVTKWRGGGIYVNPGAWTAQVVNCVISGNTAYDDAGNTPEGGAFYAGFAGRFGLLVSNCVFRDNFAGNLVQTNLGRAGAILINSTGRKHITQSLFENNGAANAGGAVVTLGLSYLEMEHCTLRRNHTTMYTNAASGGGAILLDTSGLLDLRNSLIYDNWTFGIGRGGAINTQTRGSNYVLYVYNSTIVSNRSASAAIYARAVSAANGGTPPLYMVNSIVQSNVPQACYLETLPETTNTILYSCYSPAGVVGALVSESNTTSSPVFVDFAGHDFHLAKTSPCINTGTNLDWLIGTVDLDGNPRISTVGPKIVDMGAYEFQTEFGTVLRVR